MSDPALAQNRRSRNIYMRKGHYKWRGLYEQCCAVKNSQCQDDYYRKKKKKKTPKGTTSVGENVQKTDHSYPVGGNAKWDSHCGKQYGDSSES